jgi:hypothetical protein
MYEIIALVMTIVVWELAKAFVEIMKPSMELPRDPEDMTTTDEEEGKWMVEYLNAKLENERKKISSTEESFW